MQCNNPFFQEKVRSECMMAGKVQLFKQAESTIQLEGGYETEFVTALPSEVQCKCSICLNILRDPYILATCKCGKSFCKTCIDPICKRNKRCPLCNNNFNDVIPNRNLKLILNDKDVYCTNEKDGCKWKGKLRDLGKHLNIKSNNELEGCTFAKLNCIFCDELVCRKSLFEHRSQLCSKRPFVCEYCNIYKSNYDEVTEKHVKDCPHAPVKCTNEGCEVNVKRKDLQKHIDEACPESIIKCEFNYAGCCALFPRKNLGDHYIKKISLHMSLIAKHGQSILIKSQERIVKLEKENEDLKKSVAELTKTNTELKRSLGALESKIIEKFKAFEVQSEANKTELIVFMTAEMQKVKHQISSDREFLQSRIKEEVEKQMELRQDGGLKTQVNELSDKIDFVTSQVIEDNKVLSKLHTDRNFTRSGVAACREKIENIHNYTSVTLTSRAKLFPIEIIMKDFPNYQVSSAEWVSAPFYINKYKLCMSIHANGDPGKRDRSVGFVSLYLHLMPGENDDTLSWPFQCTIFLKLVDPNFPKGMTKMEELRFSKKTTPMYTNRVIDTPKALGWGFDAFISQQEIQKYLWDDGNELHIIIDYKH